MDAAASESWYITILIFSDHVTGKTHLLMQDLKTNVYCKNQYLQICRSVLSNSRQFVWLRVTNDNTNTSKECVPTKMHMRTYLLRHVTTGSPEKRQLDTYHVLIYYAYGIFISLTTNVFEWLTSHHHYISYQRKHQVRMSDACIDKIMRSNQIDDVEIFMKSNISLTYDTDNYQ